MEDTPDAVLTLLMQGCPLYLCLQNNQHAVVIVGIEGDQLIVNDPKSDVGYIKLYYVSVIKTSPCIARLVT
jgi:hypothetical protein